MLDTTHRDSPTIGELFARYGIDVVENADGGLTLEGLPAQRLSRKMTIARRAHRIAASGTLAELEALAVDAAAVDDYDPAASHRFVVEPGGALSVLAAVDLALRVETICEASDPLEELRFLVNAANTGDAAPLGERVAAAAALCATR